MVYSEEDEDDQYVSGQSHCPLPPLLGNTFLSTITVNFDFILNAMLSAVSVCQPVYRLKGLLIFTARKLSCRKVMFLHLSVILFTGRVYPRMEWAGGVCESGGDADLPRDGH